MELNITAGKDIEVGGCRKAILSVPVPQLRSFLKVHVQLMRELEKFSGKHSVYRTGKNPALTVQFHDRTLTAVHDTILEDLVFPREIVGKRIRVKLDCSRLIKIHLDKAQQNNVEHKEIEVGGSRKAIIFVPVPQLRSFQKIQVRLVRELEKEFSGKHVLFIAQLFLCWCLQEAHRQRCCF
ncbi:hypothetical protein UPYG_G00254830 [Umbra pygmaea]|uniref:40S ribosomal protein S7 n=1 Tax=Umbra pygmaea TaxID=75934 RepID=A0ABD0WS81_UMBPY